MWLGKSGITFREAAQFFAENWDSTGNFGFFYPTFRDVIMRGVAERGGGD
jgi:hypothetical protein